MAIELKTGIIGSTAVPVSSIYGETATQKFPIGTQYVTEDGRKFRYAKNGAVALGRALMCQAPVEIAHHKEIVIGTAAAVGDTTLTISTTLSTATTADQYKDGFIIINKGTGLGQTYRVKSNTAGTTCTVTLYDPVVIAIAATAEFTLKANPWNGVIVSATTQTGIPVGVPLNTVTIGYYCWLQTHGPAGMTVDTGDTVVLGHPVGKPGTNAVAGACGTIDSAVSSSIAVLVCNIYGNCMTVGAADETALVFLTLE